MGDRRFGTGPKLGYPQSLVKSFGSASHHVNLRSSTNDQSGRRKMGYLSFRESRGYELNSGDGAVLAPRKPIDCSYRWNRLH